MPGLTVMVHSRDETGRIGFMVEDILVGLEIVVVDKSRHM